MKERSFLRGVFDGVEEVFSQGIKMVKESIHKIYIIKVSYAVVNQVSISVGRIIEVLQYSAFFLCYPDSDICQLDYIWGAHGSSTVLGEEVSIEFEEGIVRTEGDLVS